MVIQYLRYIVLLSAIGGMLYLPLEILAQETQAKLPDTIKEAQELGKGILWRLPKAIGEVFRKEVVPAWKNIWSKGGEFFQKIWESIKRIIEERKPVFEKELKEEKREVQEEFQTDTLETGKKLWERFKKLLD